MLVSFQVSTSFCAIRMPNTVKNVLPNRLPKRVLPVQRSSTITFSSERRRALQCVETRYTLQGSHLVPNKYRVRKKTLEKRVVSKSWTPKYNGQFVGLREICPCKRYSERNASEPSQAALGRCLRIEMPYQQKNRGLK